jgi:hypothetical protein
MSSPDEPPEEMVDTEDVSGLDELIPPRLMPIWSRVRLIQDFRGAHGRTYVKVMEAIIAVVLTVGYAYWLSLYLAA